MSRYKLFFNIIDLLNESCIILKDIKEFSEEFKADIIKYINVIGGIVNEIS